MDVTFASEHIFHMVEGWRVGKEHSFSDHRYITFNFNICPASQKSFRNPRRTNWSKYREVLNRLLPSGVPEPPATIEDMDRMVESISHACNQSFSAACPEIKPRGKQKPAWWSKELGTKKKSCRMAFNKAKRTRESQDWDSYKETLRLYKRELKKAQRSSWRLFCDKMEDVSETSRLRKILSTNPTNIGYLIKPDGSWTDSSEESLKLLMDTHFPGSLDNSMELRASGEACSLRAPDIVNKKRILWAIKGSSRTNRLDRIGLYRQKSRTTRRFSSRGWRRSLRDV